ncbi:hypothetical protein [Actinoplanes sp. GCM10030250]|uniref:hypothetical protein n=1 Tax=Actinoplanes sp. GCM10030250 TaxID=3273376 RepID=UPI003606D9A0
MTDSGLQGWHVSLFVTLLVLLIQWLAHQVLPAGRSGAATGVRPAGKSQAAGRAAGEPETTEPRRRELAGKRLRAGYLAALGAIAVVIVAVSLLGPTLADQLAGVTATALGSITLWLAWLSYKESVKLSAMIQTGATPEEIETGAKTETDQSTRNRAT